VIGVVGLANDIEVQPRDQRTDGEIAHAAVEALKAHTFIREGKVRPVVKDGVVTLEGELEWQFQRDAAVGVVRSLRGVKQVINQTVLKPKMKPNLSDIRIKIEDALKRSAQIDAREITVAMTDSTIVLRGSVRSYWEREEAETATWGHRASPESTTGSRSLRGDMATTTNEGTEGVGQEQVVRSS
jgi:osmotically-inducible protein OsmY